MSCVLAWSRIPDTTKESQLEFCLCIAGAGARVSKGALLLKTPWTWIFTDGLSLRTEAPVLSWMLSPGECWSSWARPDGCLQCLLGACPLGTIWPSEKPPGSASPQQCREVRAAGTRGTSTRLWLPQSSHTLCCFPVCPNTDYPPPLAKS